MNPYTQQTQGKGRPAEEPIITVVVFKKRKKTYISMMNVNIKLLEIKVHIINVILENVYLNQSSKQVEQFQE